MSASLAGRSWASRGTGAIGLGRVTVSCTFAMVAGMFAGMFAMVAGMFAGESVMCLAYMVLFAAHQVGAIVASHDEGWQPGRAF